MTSDDQIDVLGHFGQRNFGDELMLAGMEHLVAASGRGSVLRPWTLHESGALARRIASRRGGHLVAVAGSSFHDLYPRGRRHRHQQAVKVAYVALLTSARARGWKTAFVGSIGPSWRPGSVALDRRLARSSQVIFARDARTAEFAATEARRAAETHLVPDLALPAIAAFVASRRALPDHRPDAALVCPAVDRQFPEWRYPPAEATTEALVRAGFREMAVSPSHAASATDGDAEAVDALVAAGNRSGLVTSVTGTISQSDRAGLERALSVIPAYGVTISARLHPAMAAAALGCRVVIAPYHPKLREVIDVSFTGIPELGADADHAEISSAIAKAMAEAPEPRENMTTWRPDLARLLVG